MTTSLCPADSALRMFVEGHDPPAGLAEHINACERCQDRLDGLAAGDALPQGAASRLRAGVGDATHIAAAIDNIKRAVTEPAPDEFAFPPGLIAASDYPGALGRLGQYELLQILGRGGMGAVFKAFDPSLHRVVAIKLLAPHLAHNPLARKRFLREAQAAAAVSHDHVVTIHAIDEVAEQPAIVMQYVQGRSLQQKLEAEGPLPLSEILRIGLQSASGLAAAHAQGLVHRDVKPANILLENGVQRVKLTDFGLARTVDENALTASGAIAGTPQYMSPEQAQGETITPQSDLFSLGGVMYAMCTGNSPFRASTAMGVLKKVCEATPRPIRDVNPDIPDWLCGIIDRLLAKDCARRFATARELAALLELWLAHVQQPLAVARPDPQIERSPTSATAVIASPAAGGAAGDATACGETCESSAERRDRVCEIAIDPYAHAVASIPLVAGAASARDRLHGPAWGLMTLGGMGSLVILSIYVALVYSIGIEQLGCRPSGWGMPILPILLLLLLFGFGFAGMFIAGRRLTLLLGLSVSVIGCLLAILVPPSNVIGLPLGVWGLVLLRRREIREIYAAQYALECSVPGNPDGLALLRERLGEPALALVVTGLLNWLFVVMLGLITLEAHVRQEPVFRQMIVPRYPILIALCVLFSVTSTVTTLAGVRMLSLRSYRLAVVGAACAAVTLPGILLGAPIAAWALVTLMQPKVRAAFAAARQRQESRPNLSATRPWRQRWFWIMTGALALCLGFVVWWGLSPIRVSSVASQKDPSANEVADSSPLPPSFVLERPDYILPIGRTDTRRMVVSAGGGHVAAAGGSGTEGFVKIWNAQTLLETGLQTSAYAIHSLAFGDHGRFLATGEADGTIRMRDGKTGDVLWEIAAHGTPVTAVAFGGPSGGLISGGEDGTLRLWMNRQSSPIEFPRTSGAISDIASTRDGARIAVACRDRVVHLWDSGGQPIMQFTFPANPVRITLDEVDGRLAVALENGVCEVISLKERQIAGRWYSSPGVSPLDLRTGYWQQPRAAVFISAADNGWVAVVDFNGFRQCATLQSESPALGADLVAGQDRIVSAHSDGQLRIWNLNRP